MSDYTPTTEEVRDDWDALMLEGGISEGSRADANFDSDRRNAQFDRWLAEVERAAAEKAWKRLAEIVYPLYEAAEAVLLAGADTQKLMGPLAKLGAQSNPYRLNEGEKQ